MTTRQRNSTPLLRAADWVAAALELIAERGLPATSVEALARRLGVTKGSFYHHFPNRAALIAAALEEWEVGWVGGRIAQLELIRDPAERLRTLAAGAFTNRTGGMLTAALSTSSDDPLVRPVLQRVTERRLRFIADAYGELGWPEDRASRRAALLYMPYVGLFNYLRSAPGEPLTDRELRAYADDLVAALVSAYTSTPHAQR